MLRVFFLRTISYSRQETSTSLDFCLIKQELKVLISLQCPQSIDFHKVHNLCGGEKKVSKQISIKVEENEPPFYIFIVPSLWDETTEGEYMITVLSDQPNEYGMKFVGNAKDHDKFTATAEGEWNDQTAGGNYTLPNWRSNPCFLIRSSRPNNRVSVQVSIAGISFSTSENLVFMDKKHSAIGLYVVQNNGTIYFHFLIFHQPPPSF